MVSSDRKHLFIEARFILYAVRYAEIRYPQERFLIFSDNLAMVLALCSGRSNNCSLRSVVRRVCASDFVLSFWFDTVRVE